MPKRKRSAEEEGDLAEDEGKAKGLPIPPEILLEVLKWCIPRGRVGLWVVLRSVCREWARIALLALDEKTPPRPDARIARYFDAGDLAKFCDCPATRTAATLFVDAASLGYTDLCAMGRSMLPILHRYSASWLNVALRAAALGGHADTCRVILGWGAKDYPGMIEAARGNREVIKLADDSSHMKDENAALLSAARRGDSGACFYAMESGATKIDRMLEIAAEAGHLDACELAMSHGARDADVMMRLGARGGFPSVCRRAKGRGATDFRGMLFEGASANHANVCRIAEKWGRAARGDEWREGGKLYEDLLLHGAEANSEGACRYAKEMGARDFDGMLKLCRALGNRNLAPLAARWKLE